MLNKEQIPSLLWNLDNIMLKKNITNEELADATELSIVTIIGLRENMVLV